MQIAHCGLFSNPDLTGEPAPGPSVRQSESEPIGREMTEDDIQQTINAFCSAAERAQRAGFDAVQVHAAHGYGLSQFLSPYFNKRGDKYGGSLENRARMLLEIVRNIVRTIGKNFPVLVKINAEDRLAGGFTVDEMVEVSLMLQEAGVDGIELSGGTSLGLKNKKPENSFSRVENKEVVYWHKAAERYKKEIKVPLILVGGIRSYETANRLVKDGITDYISFCRPLLREPDLVKRWHSGNRTDSACVSDNGCFTGPGKVTTCIHLP